jgi:hypothetical protein
MVAALPDKTIAGLPWACVAEHKPNPGLIMAKRKKQLKAQKRKAATATRSGTQGG